MNNINSYNKQTAVQEIKHVLLMAPSRGECAKMHLSLSRFSVHKQRRRQTTADDANAVTNCHHPAVYTSSVSVEKEQPISQSNLHSDNNHQTNQRHCGQSVHQ